LAAGERSVDRVRAAVRSIHAQVLRRRQHRVVILTEPPEPSPFPPIFVIGCTRSGTSLVRRVLDSHSRIACPPESHFLVPLLSVLSDRRSMLGLESLGFGRETVVSRLREFSERFFLEYAASTDKPRWADKTPFYVDHLDAIDEVFGPETRYVMVYRHGLDVTYSMCTALAGFVASLHGPDDRDAHSDARIAATYWQDKVARMLAFEAAHPDRTLHVRYERFTADPEHEVARMFAFLGEEFERTTLDFNATHHDEGLEDGRIRGTNEFLPAAGAYRQWEPEKLAIAVRAAQPGLDMLSYGPP
jgi:hypothetical protein